MSLAVGTRRTFTTAEFVKYAKLGLVLGEGSGSSEFYYQDGKYKIGTDLLKGCWTYFEHSPELEGFDPTTIGVPDTYRGSFNCSRGSGTVFIIKKSPKHKRR